MQLTHLKSFFVNHFHFLIETLSKNYTARLYLLQILMHFVVFSKTHQLSR